MLDGAQAGHFAYVGDTLVGNRVNFGAGTKCANLKMLPGNVVVKTASGSVGLGTVTSGASVKSASGEVKVQRFSGSDLDIKTMSGDVTVGLVPGLDVDARITAVSGEFENRVEPSGVDPVGVTRLAVKSFSGDVALRDPW